MKDKPYWMELCQKISIEQDPDRFMELVIELNRLLDDKKERLRPSQPKQDMTPP